WRHRNDLLFTRGFTREFLGRLPGRFLTVRAGLPRSWAVIDHSRRFHIADNVTDGCLLTLVLQHGRDRARSRSRQFNCNFGRFDHDDGIVLMYRLAWILEPVSNFNFSDRLAN